jgi:hypothetical protein
MPNKFICPVCGYADLDDAPYDEYGCSSFSICPCCGTEFGYDDQATSHEALRQQWISSGMRWWSANTQPPTDFDPVAQLKKLVLSIED